MKKALIIGASGQDGTFLTKFLQSKKYKIICTSRKLSKNNYSKHKLIEINQNSIIYEKLDIQDIEAIRLLVKQYLPDEIYNLSAQSSVGFSYIEPFETMNSIVNGTLNLLEVLREINKEIKFYSAGSGEAFGDYGNKVIDENSCFRPISPYGVGKASASLLVKSYRDSYNLKCCTGHLFNHESYLRGDSFVTKKIILSAIEIDKGNSKSLTLGNTEIYRDWGWAPDFVEAMWLMLQQKNVDDYIISTGKSISLLEFVSITFEFFGLDYKKYLKVDKKLFRPSDIIINKSNPKKAKDELGWQSKLKIKDIINEMIQFELNKSKK